MEKKRRVELSCVAINGPLYRWSYTAGIGPPGATRDKVTVSALVTALPCYGALEIVAFDWLIDGDTETQRISKSSHD